MTERLTNRPGLKIERMNLGDWGTFGPKTQNQLICLWASSRNTQLGFTFPFVAGCFTCYQIITSVFLYILYFYNIFLKLIKKKKSTHHPPDSRTVSLFMNPQWLTSRLVLWVFYVLNIKHILFNKSGWTYPSLKCNFKVVFRSTFNHEYDYFNILLKGSWDTAWSENTS